MKTKTKRGWFNSKRTPQLSYLIGAVLADGSIVQVDRTYKKSVYHTLRLQIEVKDQDFMDEFIKCARTVVSTSLKTYKNKPRGNSLPTTTLHINHSEFCKWLIIQTNRKNNIPHWIFNSSNKHKRAILRGLMDGDGYITMGRDSRKKKNGKTMGRSWQSQMGIASKFPWLYEANTLFKSIKVKVGSVKPMSHDSNVYQFSINKKSFYEANMRFSIKRKQERLDKYIHWLESSETIRST